MKTIFTSIAIILSQLLVFAQSDNQSWKLYTSIEGIEIYTMETDCRTDDIPAQKAIILKLVNTTGQNLRIEWDLSVWYNYEKLIHDVKDGENHYSIDLNPNQSTQGSCETPYGALYIFKDFITYVSPTKLTNFALENLRITKI